MLNDLKIGRAEDLTGRARKFYRLLEIFPGALSWLTLIALIFLSYWQPLWVAVFLLFFDVYWLLLVGYYGLYLLIGYWRFRRNLKIDWEQKCRALGAVTLEQVDLLGAVKLIKLDWNQVYHLVIFPTYKEEALIIRSSLQAILDSGYPLDKLLVVLATEERGGASARQTIALIDQEFGSKFPYWLITAHPGDIVGEEMGKGANQAWAAKQARQKLILPLGLDEDKILVSVFDIDTAAQPGYFHILTYKFLTAAQPYRVSYQPVPLYNNNIWQAPWFSRVASFSNTFWQMIQQVRVERMATYSSHSMTWRALLDIDFWSTNMVSEDSRVFFHCFCYYRGAYRVEPLHFPVYMDACLDKGFWITAKNLYKQQRRWGWGVENVPYLLYQTIKRWRQIPKIKFLHQIFTSQLYGFHSWATYALIIGVIGWLPLLLGGGRFNTTVLSTNLPQVSQILMTIAMVGLILSAALSSILLPPRPKNISRWRRLSMIVQWLVLPLTIIIFGSIPALEAQTRLMLGKYLGFWVTPKER